MPESITEEKVSAIIKALDWITKNVWPFLSLLFLGLAIYMFYLLQQCQSEAKKEQKLLQDENKALNKEMLDRAERYNNDLNFIYKNIKISDTSK